MKPLEPSFTKHGFQFAQVKRAGNVAIFSKRREHWMPDSLSLEVVKVQQHADRQIAGVAILATEALPPSESWGTDGFTFSDLRTATAKFNSLLPV